MRNLELKVLPIGKRFEMINKILDTKLKIMDLESNSAKKEIIKNDCEILLNQIKNLEIEMQLVGTIGNDCNDSNNDNN